MTDARRRFTVRYILTVNRPEGRHMGKRTETVENDAYAEMMGRCIRALGRRIGEGDVEHIGLALDLRRQLDAAIADGVRRLNDQGESWARIGRGAGITKQTAQERWGRKAGHGSTSN